MQQEEDDEIAYLTSDHIIKLMYNIENSQYYEDQRDKMVTKDPNAEIKLTDLFRDDVERLRKLTNKQLISTMTKEQKLPITQHLNRIAKLLGI